MEYISSKKLKESKQELEELKKNRHEISARILEAKDKGDISENAEYTEAKESQAFNEGKIQELDQIIRQAVVISKKMKCDVVEVGCEVVVKNKTGKHNFMIVGSKEADPVKGKISNESPLGQAFLGKKKNDEFLVQTPKGKTHYKILQVK